MVKIQMLLRKQKTLEKQLEKIEKKSSKLRMDLLIQNDLIEIENLKCFKTKLKEQRDSAPNKKIDYLKSNRNLFKRYLSNYYLKEIKYNYDIIIELINDEIFFIKNYLGPNNDYRSI